ncbi:MAG TPA: kelch repeat-containing protein [Emticicia sp.]
MKLKNIAILILLPCTLFAQKGKWENYSERNNQNKNKNDYLPDANKQQAAASVTNPAPRNASTNWQDKQGNVYIFGGLGIDNNLNVGTFADLWQFNAKNLVWKNLSGSRDIEKFNKDTKKKLAVTATTPSPRQSAATWTDKQGNLYMFGGNTGMLDEYLSDFWIFDIKKQNWTQLSNSKELNKKNQSTGKNKNNTNNLPAARAKAATWVDNKGDFWLFGGTTHDYTLGRDIYFNDLWKYDTNKNNWLWVSGNLEGNTKVEVAEIIPSARFSSAAWFDGTNNGLWLYGGFGLNSTATAYGGLSDMWFFDVKKEKWTLKSGDYKLSKSGTVKSIAKESAANNPGFRYSSITWQDKKGNFWLYGGQFSFKNDTLKSDRKVWKYNLKTSSWSTIFTNTSPSILASGAAMIDEQNNVWLLCGEFIDNRFNMRYSNGIWKFNEE